MFLLDTMVISEETKRKPHEAGDPGSAGPSPNGFS